MALKEHSYSLKTLVLEKDLVHLYADITIGASGAVTSVKGGGIATVVKQGTAGQYNVTLDSAFSKLLFLNATFVGSAASTIDSVQVLMTDAAAKTALKTGAAIVIQLYNAAGTAADATSGSVMKLKLEVRRTTVGPFD